MRSSLRVPDWPRSIAGIDAPVGELAVEDQLHVAGALELLKDQVVHPAAGLDQAVPSTVSEPPSSKTRAEPKSRFGISMARISTPPDMVRPPGPTFLL